jgi:hypothetical protein
MAQNGRCVAQFVNPVAAFQLSVAQHLNSVAPFTY